MSSRNDPATPEADADRVALGLYEALLDGAGLLPALRGLARRIGAASHSVHLVRFAKGRPVGTIGQTEGGVSDAAMAAYAGHWIRHDPWAKALAALGPGVHDMAEHVAPEVRARGPFWEEWGRPNDAGFYTLAVPLRHEGEWHSGLYFHRRRNLGPFPAEARLMLKAVFPHLERVFAAEARLAPVRGAPGSVLGLGLDALPDGIALLDGSRDLVFANAALRGMAAMADGLALGPQGIEVADPRARAALARAVTAALAAAAGRVGLLPAAGSLALSRPSGRPPWLVRALPLPAGTTAPVGPGFRGAMLMVTDAARRAAPGPALLGRLFGLTPAQSSLAAALVAGRSIEEHAARRGVSRETVRSHLAEIRRKTGCRRQAELALLFSRLPS